MIVSSIVALAACTGPAASPTASGLLAGDPPCTEVRTEVPSDDASALGFSADDVLSVLEGERSATMTYHHTGVAVGLRFQAERGPGAVILRTWDAPATDPSRTCPPATLGFAIDARLSTEDGALDESWREDFERSSFTGVHSFLLEVDVASLTGTLDTTGLDSISVWNTINGANGVPAEMYGVVDGVDFVDGETTYGVAESGRCIARWNMPDDTPCHE